MKFYLQFLCCSILIIETVCIAVDVAGIHSNHTEKAGSKIPKVGNESMPIPEASIPILDEEVIVPDPETTVESERKTSSPPEKKDQAPATPNPSVPNNQQVPPESQLPKIFNTDPQKTSISTISVPPRQSIPESSISSFYFIDFPSSGEMKGKKERKQGEKKEDKDDEKEAKQMSKNDRKRNRDIK
jgi:hypothetical protein